MKNILFTTLILIISLASTAQKVKIKKPLVTVDGVEYANWEKDDIVKINRLVKNLNGDILLLAIYKSYVDPNEVTQSNPKGNVAYYEITDPESGEVYFEYQGFPKHLFKAFYNGGVINEDGSLNLENLKRVGSRFGHEFSRKRGEKPKVIIVK